MYALQMQSACQGKSNNEPDDTCSPKQEPVRQVTQDCSSFDIVRATQVSYSIRNKFIGFLDY